MHSNFACLFLSFADFFFFKINIFKTIFRNTIRVSDSLDPDLVQHFVGPDVGPNCLQINSNRHWQTKRSFIMFEVVRLHESSES